MQTLKVLIFVIALTSVTSQTTNQTNDEKFQLFLENALLNYPAWLRENNFDPSYPSNQTYDISVIGHPYFNLTCITKDEQVLGMTNETNSIEIWDNTAHLTIRSFYFSYITRGKLEFQGNYTANGTTENSISVEGTGPWKYTTLSGIRETNFYRFNITDDGYVDITEGPVDYSVFAWNNAQVNINFDGLLDNGAGGYAQDIKYNLLYQYHLRLLQSQLGQPTFLLMQLYLTEIFGKSPLDEIIGQNVTSFFH